MFDSSWCQQGMSRSCMLSMKPIDFVKVSCVEVRLVKADVEPVKSVEVFEVLDFVEVRQYANCWLDHSSFLNKK